MKSGLWPSRRNPDFFLMGIAAPTRCDADREVMASKAASTNKGVLIPLALLCAFLFCQTFGLLPTTVNDEIVRWASCAVFVVSAVLFGASGSAVWCGLCAALAVVLNPLYPLALGDLFSGAKIVAGVVAGAAVVRNW
jgi:hypothetical protein